MKRIILSTAILAAILALLSCGEEGDVTGNYFPNKDQSEWHYSCQYGTLIAKFNGTANHSTLGSLQVLETYYDSYPGDFYYLLVNSEGVTAYRYLDDTNYRWEAIKYPLENGKSWDWTINADLYTATVTSINETVGTPLRTFTNCIVIEYRINGELDGVAYLASDVGAVRLLIGELEWADLKLTYYTIP